MPRQSKTDWAAVDALLASRENVVTHAELRALNVVPSTITRRIRPRGPWQRAAPGVVIAHSGLATRREKVLAALAFGGPGAVVTGADALHAAGAPPPALDAPIHVLVPERRQRKSFGTIRVERSRRLPTRWLRHGIPYAPAARAAVDFARHCTRLDEVRDVISSTLQWKRASLAQIALEVRSAARQRTALSRAVLAEVSAGIRSVAEAKARDALSRFGVPAPVWNARLFTAAGALFLTPDAFWPAVAAALEIDSLAWHLDPASYRRSKARERRLTLHGVLVLSFTPAEIIDEPAAFVEQVQALLALAASRPVPEGITWETA